MFDNIGRKIKGLAKFVCWVGIICSIISGIMMATTGGAGVLAGIMTIIIGGLCSWVGSFVLYGFGEIVQNSDTRTELAVKAAGEKKEQ